MKFVALPSKDKVLKSLLTQDGQFQHVLKVDRHFWVADRINSLTALCSPSLRRGDGQGRVEYELLLTVVDDLREPSASLESSLRSGRYVGLPRLYDPRHTLDTFVNEDALTPWLINEMRSDMHRLTLGRNRALAVIANGEDQFIEKLKRVFGGGFARDIVGPLENLR